MSNFSLPGKVALVTGSARGIGFETAKLLHERGASVAVLDLDLEQARTAAERIGERTLALSADVTDYKAMQGAVSEVIERFGGLDLVIANAGIAPDPSPVDAMGYEEFERVLDVDLYGVWRTVHAALPPIIERKGHVVVVASVYAFMNGAMEAPYAMAKAGVEQFGRALRAELTPIGASASVAYFGFIDTDMVRDAYKASATQIMDDSIPAFIRRRLKPSQAAAAVVRGIENRKPRIIAPRYWAIASTLRGILNPLIDRRMERDENVREALRTVRAGRAGRDDAK